MCFGEMYNQIPRINRYRSITDRAIRCFIGNLRTIKAQAACNAGLWRSFIPIDALAPTPKLLFEDIVL